MTVLMSESLFIHSNGWFIRKRGMWLSFWMGYWINDLLDSFKNVGSFSNETPLFYTKQICCGFDWNFVSELEQKQSILYYKLWTLCLLHSQWRTSTPTTCLHADVSVSVPSKRTGSVLDDIKVPRERFEFGKHVEHLLSVALAVLWCHTAIGLCIAASNQTEKGTLVEHTPVYELAISFSLSAQTPPPKEKTSSDLDDSHKWHILIQSGEFRWKATSLQVWFINGLT